jgi:hypothetical protein
MAGQTKETQMGWRLDPTANTAGLIALAMVVHQASQTGGDFWVFLGKAES